MSRDRWRFAMGLVAIVPFSCGGCSRASEEKVRIADLPYAIPASELDSYIEPKNGMMFVRATPPGDRLMLMIDTQADRVQAKQGKLVVSGLNTHAFGEFSYLESEAGTIVCRDTPRWQCGFEIYDRAVRWTVQFHKEDLSEVSLLHAQASSVIAGYRI